MASWLELLLNVIGYGGFVVLAIWHPSSHVEDRHDVGSDDSPHPTR